MKNKLLSLLLGIAALGISGSQPLDAQAFDATGVWLATDVPYAPWTVQLKQDGTNLTGTMEQNGGLRGTVSIYEGVINGSALSFKANSPDGARAITFTGAINGNEITLNRATQILTNASQGGFRVVRHKRSSAVHDKTWRRATLAKTRASIRGHADARSAALGGHGRGCIQAVDSGPQD